MRSVAVSLFVAAIGSTGLLARSASATSVLPFGVQNDVSVSTVAGWGWTVAYQGTYDQTLSINTLFANATGDYVMLAAIHHGSSTYDVLGAALATDVRQVTAYNQTHVANGVGWYYNTYSMGFAGATDTIQQNSADVNGFTERDRLSWHTDGTYPAGAAPTTLRFGFRSGSNAYLNSSTDWDRVVLTMSADAGPTPVPLPAAVPAGVALLGVLAAKRRRGRAG